MANLLTDKYAEGFPHHRFYAGCDNVDAIEELAADQASELFGAEHAYVQPHSGADANLVAFWAILSAASSARTVEAARRRRTSAELSRLTPTGPRCRAAACGNQRLLGMDLRTRAGT